MTEQLSTAYMVVVENGAEQIPSMDEPSGATERAIIAQQPDESASELAIRVIRRAQELAKNRTPIECAVIVASGAVHEDVFASRCNMARALVRAMSGAPSARLLFAPPSSLSDEGRHELLSIAGTLAMQLRHVPVEVSVRFQAPPEEPRSGVHLRKPLRYESELAAGLA